MFSKGQAMAHHGRGEYRTSDFWVKTWVFLHAFDVTTFSNMADAEDFCGSELYLYSLPISNPNILF